MIATVDQENFMPKVFVIPRLKFRPIVYYFAKTDCKSGPTYNSGANVVFGEEWMIIY